MTSKPKTTVKKKNQSLLYNQAHNLLSIPINKNSKHYPLDEPDTQINQHHNIP